MLRSNFTKLFLTQHELVLYTGGFMDVSYICNKKMVKEI